MTYLLPRPIAFAFGLYLCAALPNIVSAEGELEEVVVTAQKREQNLQDVPVAVSAFSGEVLRDSGVRDMFELTNIAPSLTVTAAQTSTTTAFGIRGIFTSSQNFGLESSVGLYVDGVYRARQGSMTNNLVDIASIEVLRGPQGTLFGRNTPAGAVLVNSEGPDFEGTGFLEAGAGDYDLLDFSGAKSFTVIDDVLAVRFTGFNTDRDGFIDVVGKEIQKKDAFNDRNRWGGRFQVLYTPNDDLRLRFIGDHSEVDEICCGLGNWKNNFYAQNPPPPQKPGTDLTVRDTLGGTVISDNDFYDHKVSASFEPESQNTDEGLSLQADWQTDYFLVTSISAYRKHDSYDNTDPDAYDVDALIRTNDLKQDQYSQELRISDDNDKLSYVAGLYYYYQELDTKSDTILGPDASPVINANFGVSLPPSFFPAGSSALNVADQTHYSYAAFGQADYHVTEQFIVTAGLRWTTENKDMTNIFTENPTPAPPGFDLFGPFAPREDVDEKFDESKVTGTFKLSWFMNDLTMFYASYGTGYKSGGINTDRVLASVDTVFEPETSEAYELGIKSDYPDQALRVNLALHKTDTADLQTISFQGTGFTLDNAGTAETYGGEMDLLWLPTDDTTITLGYAYNHAEYADFQDGPCWTGTPWQTSQSDPGANGDGTCDRSGGMVSGNPETVSSLSANQRFQLSEGYGAFIHGEFIYTDERMTDVNNDPEKLDGSYNVVNLRSGIVFERYNATLTFWGRNVFDAESTTLIGDAVAQDGRFIAYYKEPATWGVSVRKTF